MNALACAYLKIGKTKGAVTLTKQASGRATQHLGPGHEFTWAFLDTLSDAYEADGQVDEMFKVLKQIDELTLHDYGPTHARTIDSKRVVVE